MRGAPHLRPGGRARTETTRAGRAGTFRHILGSLEFTRREPVVIDQKIYAPGVGIVLERAVRGPAETARLVRVTG